MTTTPHPTWYDVLGVSRDASPDEIKAAWRNATDKFEPGSGSGQFRMFNEAADVLLDPARRAAYDASLDAGPARPAAAPHPSRARGRPGGPGDAEPAAGRRRRRAPRAPRAAAEKPRQRRRPARGAGHRWAGLHLVALAVLAVLTVAAVVAAVVLGLKVRTEAEVADARDAGAGGRGAGGEGDVLLRLPDTCRPTGSAPRRYLTDAFEKEYLKNFDAAGEAEGRDARAWPCRPRPW